MLITEMPLVKHLVLRAQRSAHARLDALIVVDLFERPIPSALELLTCASRASPSSPIGWILSHDDTLSESLVRHHQCHWHLEAISSLPSLLDP